MIAVRSEYQGKPTLTLKRFEDEKYPFSFGVEKAKRIMESLEEIKKFIADEDKGNSQPSKYSPPAMKSSPPPSDLALNTDDDMPF